MYRFKKILVPEINNGQLVKLLRQKYLVPARGFNKIKGLPLNADEIEQAIEALRGETHA